jgi:hypothetical protein
VPRRRTRTALLVALAVVSAHVLVAAPARAGNDMAAAEALFHDARRLLADGKLAEACQKFAQSQELDPSSGTLLNLALCHEEQGLTASAWAEFLAAARLAKAQQRPDREEEARRRAEALAPKLSYLTITVEAPVEGLVVRRNGEQVPAGEIGTKLPMDPGSYEIVATAPARAEWRLVVRLDPGGGFREIVVPPLEAKETPNPPEERAEPPRGPDGGTVGAGAEEAPEPTPTLGYTLVGLGTAALVTGTVFGILALGSHSDAKSDCPTLRDCSPETMEARDRAGTQATIANIGIGAGLLGVGVGAVLILTSGPSERDSRAAIGFDLVALPSGGTAQVRGTF